MSSKTIIIIITIFILSGVGIGLVSFDSLAPRAEDINQAGPPVARDRLTTEKMMIETKGGQKHEFDVEIARTASEQSYGLINRKTMPPNHGMLFVFVSEDERSFWMKNTLIPLDMIFIRADGTIHSIHDSAIPLDLTPVNSNGPVLAVLELNGGRAAALGIKPGDKAFQRIFKH